jgi:hypothetical protein
MKKTLFLIAGIVFIIVACNRNSGTKESIEEMQKIEHFDSISSQIDSVKSNIDSSLKTVDKLINDL